MSIRFSVIIPAYNEALYLPRLLASIKQAALNYHDGDVEIIVGDNSSTDTTVQVAEVEGCIVANIEKRSIAAARNGGARLASGDIVCFIDADSALHPETFNRIDIAMRDDQVIAGATGIYLERMSLGLLLVYCFMLPFTWLTNLDTGVVFCRRRDFETLGGYNEDMLLGEDVDFLFALKRLGQKRGQTLKRLKGVKALGSTRKFDEHGDWHYFTLLPTIVRTIVRYGFRIGPREGEATGITDYWYRPGR